MRSKIPSNIKIWPIGNLAVSGSHKPETVNHFLAWLKQHHPPGVRGQPGDWAKRRRISLEMSR
jgi:hypothetical protein